MTDPTWRYRDDDELPTARRQWIYHGPSRPFNRPFCRDCSAGIVMPLYEDSPAARRQRSWLCLSCAREFKATAEPLAAPESEGS